MDKLAGCVLCWLLGGAWFQCLQPRKMPGLLVHHQLLELAETQLDWVSDTILSFHPLLPPSSPALTLSQHQGLFHWVSCSQKRWPKYWSFRSISVLPVSIEDWSPLGWTGWISLQSQRLSRVFSNTTVQKHQFFGAQLSLWSNSHIHTWLLEKP